MAHEQATDRIATTSPDPQAPFALVARTHYPAGPAMQGPGQQRVLHPGTPFAPRPAPLFFAIDPGVADPAGEERRRFVDQLNIRLGAGFVVTLSGGSVWSDGFLVADRDRNILVDSFRSHGMLARYGFDEFEPRRLRHAPATSVTHHERLAVLGVQTNRNYFHWLLEALPRLELLRAEGLLGTVDLLVPPLKPWMEEMARLVGGADLRLLVQDAEETRAETLVVPARGLGAITAYSGHALATVHGLRERVDAPVRAGRRLYVSRTRSASRNIANEDALVAIAEAHGFERVYPETMTVAEQIATFRQAEAVAGPLGAGLTNAAFMAPGSALIEFAPEGRTGDATLFANMAHHLGLRYAGVVGPFADQPAEAQARAVDRRDFVIDEDLAKQAFAIA